MPDAADLSHLPFAWCDATVAAAVNLGLGRDLTKLSAEHWLRVLTNVEARMGMRGTTAPFGWREALARQVGRVGP